MMTMTTEDYIPVPNPGSAEALARGCTCPVLDNTHGKGIPRPDGPKFWVTEGCPLHDRIRRKP